MHELPNNWNVKKIAQVVRELSAKVKSLLNITIERGDNDEVRYSDGNVQIILAADSGEGSSGGLGPVVFNGAANGQPCFFLMNSDGVAYTTAPSGYPIANPD